jgi:hypothetical protein
VQLGENSAKRAEVGKFQLVLPGLGEKCSSVASIAARVNVVSFDEIGIEREIILRILGLDLV